MGTELGDAWGGGRDVNTKISIQKEIVVGRDQGLNKQV